MWTVSLRSSCKLSECITPRYLERKACKVKTFFGNQSWTHRGLESSEEPQLCTDSSVGDFRAPRGVGCRLHGDRRLFCEENEPLSLCRNTSVLPTLLNSESDGRTRMGGSSPCLGTARLEKVPSPLAAAAGSSFTVAPMSAHWNSASWGPALLRTGRPSRDILVRNKSAACLLRESLLLRRCSLCSLPVHGVSELCGLHAAAAAILGWIKPSADAQFGFFPAATHPDTPTLIWLAWSTGI